MGGGGRKDALEVGKWEVVEVKMPWRSESGRWSSKDAPLYPEIRKWEVTGEKITDVSESGRWLK